MIKYVSLTDIGDTEKYYENLFHEILKSMKSVLYVGYEDNDILLPIISSNNVHVTAIDFERRKTVTLANVTCKQVDYMDFSATSNKKFDLVIFSFVLHENSCEKHKSMIQKAFFMANHVMIIEPLARADNDGMLFEIIIKDYFAKQNKIKCYYNKDYWIQLLSESGSSHCSNIILKRDNCEGKKIHMVGKNESKIISVQDILISYSS